MKSRIRQLFSITIMALLFVGCSADDTTSDTNSGLEVVAINLNLNGVYAGDDVIVSANLGNSGNNIVSHDWTISAGSFEPISDTSIRWTTPSQSGSYTISLTIKDSKNNTATKTVSVQLESNPNTFEKILTPDYYRLESDNQLVQIGSFVYLVSPEVNNNFDGISITLKKFDLIGNEIWTKVVFEYPNNVFGEPLMQGTSDGHLIIFVNNYLIKMDMNGNEIWRIERDREVQFFELENGNYFFIKRVFVGATTYAYYSIITPDGVQLEEARIDPGYQVANITDIVEGNQPGTFVAIASVNIPDFPDIRSEIQILNTSGEVLQVYRSNYPTTTLINGTELAKNPDGGYSAFFTPFDQGERNIIRVTVDASLNFMNEVVYDFDRDHEVYKVIPSTTGGHLVVGSFGNSLINKSLFFRIDTAGQVVWQKEFGDFSDLMDFCSSIIELDNGDIMISGSTFRGPVGGGSVRAYLNRYNANGEL